ncbi:MAG TPA: hypothetical protein VI603_00245 [Saprospiraceae bacterium]|nr:hypothetical protein [Saprospiraceae bacterium]
MSEIQNIHPYLDGLEDDNPQRLVLWNTNAGFPLSNQIEREPPEVPAPTRPKHREIAAPAPKSDDNLQVPGTEMLSSFTQWLLTLKPSTFHGIVAIENLQDARLSSGSTLEQQVPEKPKKKKKKKKKKKEARLRETREASHLLPLDQDIVSDTLAELIAGQGHVDEAILMYRKLVNLHPEKATYYIQRISELRQGKV